MMTQQLKRYLKFFIQLIFPKICPGCYLEHLLDDCFLCSSCFKNLTTKAFIGCKSCLYNYVKGHICQSWHPQFPFQSMASVYQYHEVVSKLTNNKFLWSCDLFDLFASLGLVCFLENYPYPKSIFSENYSLDPFGFLLAKAISKKLQVTHQVFAKTSSHFACCRNENIWCVTFSSDHLEKIYQMGVCLKNQGFKSIYGFVLFEKETLINLPEPLPPFR